MTATDDLRRLLDERGVEWGANDTYRLLVTSWNDASGHSWVFMEHRDGSFSKLTVYHLTPEQAIEATLGSAESKHHHHEPTIEDVLREFANKVCSGDHLVKDGTFIGLEDTDLLAEYAAKLRLAGGDE